jgi:hypothetical protein
MPVLGEWRQQLLGITRSQNNILKPIVLDKTESAVHVGEKLHTPATVTAKCDVSFLILQTEPWILLWSSVQ